MKSKGGRMDAITSRVVYISDIVAICYGGVTYWRERQRVHWTHLWTTVGTTVYQDFWTTSRIMVRYVGSNGPLLHVPMGCFSIPLYSNVQVRTERVIW